MKHALDKRSKASTEAFMEKVRYATSEKRFQFTTDGFQPYVDATSTILGTRVHFAQLIKVCGAPREGEQRYSAGEVLEAVPVRVYGKPDPKRICTSHIERQNLSIRMGMRRMTRLTNALTKSGRICKRCIRSGSLLQLLPGSQDARGYPGDGIGNR